MTAPLVRDDRACQAASTGAGQMSERAEDMRSL